MRRLLPVLLAVVSAACAHVNRPDVDALKPAIENFHKAVRWKDFHTAADLIVPERRVAFIKARLDGNDERDLFITDYELEDAKLEPEATSVTAISRLSWYRLPSASEKTATLTSVFVWRKGAWLLESQQDGPFADLAPAPEAPKPPASEAPAPEAPAP